MKIAFFASEVMPYAKTGGLADVAGALPKFLSRLGAEVKLFMPFYRQLGEKSLPLKRVLDKKALDWPDGQGTYSVLEHQAEGFSSYFIEQDEYFDRDHLYGTPAGDYPDNGERFAFYARASLDALKAFDFPPSVIHAHDWQAAAALAYLKFRYGDDPFFRNTKSLLTIHNLAYQGLFPEDILARVDLPPSLFDSKSLEFFGKVNYLKGGILYSTAVNTVSPRYAEEIQTPEFGCGLDGLLRERSSVLHGILNGVDYTNWDPETDPLIPENFDRGHLHGKVACRKELLKLFGLSLGGDFPVAGMVTRLASQKGLDILCDALEEIIDRGIAIIILGTGDRKIQDFLVQAQERFPTHLGVKIAFDEKIAHLIYAGSDLFLIPSRYEPCGLTQMYSLKYGTVPVVRATGGLDDTIEEFDPERMKGNGFKFKDPSPEALIAALERGLKAYRQQESWAALVRNAMQSDFSWDRSAKEYFKLYRRLSASSD
jgi:starch synthase